MTSFRKGRRERTNRHVTSDIATRLPCTWDVRKLVFGEIQSSWSYDVTQTRKGICKVALIVRTGISLNSNNTLTRHTSVISTSTASLCRNIGASSCNRGQRPILVHTLLYPHPLHGPVLDAQLETSSPLDCCPNNPELGNNLSHRIATLKKNQSGQSDGRLSLVRKSGRDGAIIQCRHTLAF